MSCTVPQIDRLHRLRPYAHVAGAWREPMALACSGGGDSLALILMAARARRAGSVGPCLVVYVDHLTRPETHSEQRKVACWTRSIGLSFVAVKVEAEAQTVGGSPEASLRELRYAALARVVRTLGLAGVVTAHNADDQIETMLIRLMDGSGALGLLGMSQRTHLDTSEGTLQIFRPLLDASRDELREVCRTAGVTPIEDPTNNDLGFRRNAVRRRLVPILREIEPGFDRGLRRAIELAARDQDFVDQLARDAYPQTVRFDGREQVSVDRSALRRMHVALASRIMRRAILELLPDLGRDLSRDRVDALVKAAHGRSGATIELGTGLEARIGREWIEIARNER